MFFPIICLPILAFSKDSVFVGNSAQPMYQQNQVPSYGQPMPQQSMPTVKTCPNCGAQVYSNSKFCISCSTQIQ